MRPEIHLLFKCARRELDSPQREEIRRLLERGVDWEYLCRKATEHGVLLLLCQTLRAQFSHFVPPKILENLRRSLQANGHRNLVLAAELFRLLQELEKREIPVIPLKGPVLGSLLYGDPGLRPSIDLDLLFQKKDMPRVKAFFLERGYRMNYSLSESQKAFFIRNDFECSFVRPNGNVNVEVIWGTPGDFPLRLDFQRFWEDAEWKTLEGRKVLTLSPEHLFLCLCLHQATHCWPRLIWLCDLVQVIRLYPRLNWAALLETAQTQGCLQVLLISLRLLQDLWAVSFPDPIRREMETRREAADLAGKVLARILQEESSSDHFPGQVRFLLRVTDRVRDRIAYCLRQVFIPNINDWLAWPLPRPLFSLFYLLRPLRLATKYGWGHFRRRWIPAPQSSLLS